MAVGEVSSRPVVVRRLSLTNSVALKPAQGDFETLSLRGKKILCRSHNRRRASYGGLASHQNGSSSQYQARLAVDANALSLNGHGVVSDDSGVSSGASSEFHSGSNHHHRVMRRPAWPKTPPTIPSSGLMYYHKLKGKKVDRGGNYTSLLFRGT